MGYGTKLRKMHCSKVAYEWATKDREHFTGRWIVLKSQVIQDG